MIELTASSPDTTPLGRLREDCARARFACDAVEFALGLSEPLLQPGRGPADAAFARQMAMYLCHVGFGMSLSRVALAFGRDRSTVGHACHLMEDRRDDPAFDQLLYALEQAVRGAPAPGSGRLVDVTRYGGREVGCEDGSEARREDRRDDSRERTHHPMGDGPRVTRRPRPSRPSPLVRPVRSRAA